MTGMSWYTLATAQQHFGEHSQHSVRFAQAIKSSELCSQHFPYSLYIFMFSCSKEERNRVWDVVPWRARLSRHTGADLWFSRPRVQRRSASVLSQWPQLQRDTPCPTLPSPKGFQCAETKAKAIDAGPQPEAVFQKQTRRPLQLFSCQITAEQI